MPTNRQTRNTLPGHRKIEVDDEEYDFIKGVFGPGRINKKSGLRAFQQTPQEIALLKQKEAAAQAGVGGGPQPGMGVLGSQAQGGPMGPALSGAAGFLGGGGGISGAVSGAAPAGAGSMGSAVSPVSQPPVSGISSPGGGTPTVPNINNPLADQGSTTRPI